MTELLSGKAVDPNVRTDLRNVFLHIFDSAIVDTVPDIAADLKLKRNYVGELVGLLERIDGGADTPLVYLNVTAGEDSNDTPHDWYSTSKTVDDQDRKSAEFQFDFYVPPTAQKEAKVSTPRTPQNATPPANPADLPLCKCGCGWPVSNRKRNYLPGHDARHAGQVAKAIAELDPDTDTWDTMIAVLPSPALQQKAADMATRLLQKAAAKTQSTRAKLAGQGKSTKEIEAVQFVSGKVKVGRWEYPAEQNMTSGAVTFTKKGTVEVANAKVAASFTANEEN